MTGKNDSELLAYLSHELRTGLHAMVGHAQLLQLDGLPKQDALSVERIIDTGFYLVGLLEEVQELAQTELRAGPARRARADQRLRAGRDARRDLVVDRTDLAGHVGPVEGQHVL